MTVNVKSHARTMRTFKAGARSMRTFEVQYLDSHGDSHCDLIHSHASTAIHTAMIHTAIHTAIHMLILHTLILSGISQFHTVLLHTCHICWI